MTMTSFNQTLSPQKDDALSSIKNATHSSKKNAKKKAGANMAFIKHTGSYDCPTCEYSKINLNHGVMKSVMPLTRSKINHISIANSKNNHAFFTPTKNEKFGIESFDETFVELSKFDSIKSQTHYNKIKYISNLRSKKLNSKKVKVDDTLLSLKFESLSKENEFVIEILNFSTLKEKELGLPNRISISALNSGKLYLKCPVCKTKYMPPVDIQNLRQINKEIAKLVIDLRMLIIYMYEQYEDIHIFIDRDEHGNFFNVDPNLYILDKTFTNNNNKNSITLKTEEIDRKDITSNNTESLVNNHNTFIDEEKLSHEEDTQSSISIELINVEHNNKRVPKDILDLLNVNTILNDSARMSDILEDTQATNITINSNHITSKSNSKSNINTLKENKSIKENINIESNQNYTPKSNIDSRNKLNEKLSNSQQPKQLSNNNNSKNNITYENISQNCIYLTKKEYVDKCSFQFLEWRQQQRMYITDVLIRHPDYLLQSFNLNFNNLEIYCPMCNFSFNFVQIPIRLQKNNEIFSKNKYSATLKCQCGNVYCRARFQYQTSKITDHMINF